MIDHLVIIKGIPAKEYLLSSLGLTSKENVDVTIYSNETFSNKNICVIKVLASKDSYTLVTRELAILLELIHCESIIEEDYEVAWAYKIYELAKSYKDSNFSKSESCPLPLVILSKHSNKRLVPIRQGVHLPHDSSQINSM